MPLAVYNLIRKVKKLQSMGKDYYGILNVSRKATEDEIKKAYKKAALKWHPDRNQSNLDEANIKFKEISEAYEVLSDSNKRTIYDTYGEDGLKAGGPTSQHSSAQQQDEYPSQFGRGGPGGQTFSFSTSGNPGFMPSNPDDIFKHFFASMGGDPFSQGSPDMFSGQRRSFDSGNQMGSHQPKRPSEVVKINLPVSLEVKSKLL